MSLADSQTPAGDGAAALAPGADSSPYQLTLLGLVFPVVAHAAFNALTALGLLLIGHPVAAAAKFVGSTTFDAVQQGLVRRWLREPEPSRGGLARLGALSALRVSIYLTPTAVVAWFHHGPIEIAFLWTQVLALIVVAMGVGSLSRIVFWGFATPAVAIGAGVTLATAPGWPAAGLGLSILSLTTLLALVSNSTIRSISTWHKAFTANVHLVGDLAAARDQAVADRAEADAAREIARRADRAKSNFLATMSHEIRTPMNGVLGMAQLLRRDETSPAQIARIDTLIDSGEYLLSILNDILDVSKIDAGKLEIAPTPGNPRELLERLVEFWSPRADERGVALNLDIAVETPDSLIFDALRLRQVLFNLVGNALKFTEAGSVNVIVRATPQYDGRVNLRIAVRDTGPGIAEHHLPRLFDRFSQVEDAETRRFGGTGLGLAIVRQLMELMEGRVWVESRLGEGSTFYVEAPFHRAEESAPADAAFAEPAPEPIALDELSVLAVDDNMVNLVVLDQLLTALGLKVTKAAGGREALEILSGQPFDLVLTDIQMPDVSGVDVLQRLRAEAGPNRHTPVIALTADVTSGGRQRYLDLGFSEHSAKPIQLQDLLGAIVRAAAAGPAADNQAA